MKISKEQLIGFLKYFHLDDLKGFVVKTQTTMILTG